MKRDVKQSQQRFMKTSDIFRRSRVFSTMYTRYLLTQTKFVLYDIKEIVHNIFTDISNGR